MVRWDDVAYDSRDAAKAARVFRPDVYRQALIGTGEPLPGASSKVEGSLDSTTAVGTQQGRMTLESNRFFDGKAFDPADLPGYLASLG
jgi:NitT/TauT family transport system ATP-binding protein